MRLLIIFFISFLLTKSFYVNSQAPKTVDITSGGNRYIGEVLNGERHGKGKFIENNGTEYEGEWRNGKMHGKGVLTTPDGKRYEGELENGQMHGQGILVEKEGKYEGAFLNGKMHGEGVLNLNDGRVFKGEFKNGKYVGVSKNTNFRLTQEQKIKKVENEITGNPQEMHKQLLKKIEAQQKAKKAERNKLKTLRTIAEERELKSQKEEKKKLEEEQRAEKKRKKLNEKKSESSQTLETTEIKQKEHSLSISERAHLKNYLIKFLEGDHLECDFYKYFFGFIINTGVTPNEKLWVDKSFAKKLCEEEKKIEYKSKKVKSLEFLSSSKLLDYFVITYVTDFEAILGNGSKISGIYERMNIFEKKNGEYTSVFETHTY